MRKTADAFGCRQNIASKALVLLLGFGAAADGRNWHADLALSAATTTGTPSVSVGNFQAQMQGSIHMALLFQSIEQTLTPVQGAQASFAQWVGIAAQ